MARRNTHKVVIADEDTEYSIAFPGETNRFLVRPLSRGSVRLSLDSGVVVTGSDFSAGGGQTYDSGLLDPATLTLYLASDTKSMIVLVASFHP